MTRVRRRARRLHCSLIGIGHSGRKDVAECAEELLGRGVKVKSKRILKIRGIARGVADIDDAISALRRSRIKKLLVSR